MLRTLRIANVALIEEMELEFGPGLNVLTGETGGGKTVIMNALAQILGGRGFQGFVRTGAEEAVVEAFFESPGSAARGVLREEEYGEEGEVLVQRVVSQSGRSRARVNSRLATVEFLQRLGTRLVEIYGQHEHQVLLRPENHLALLDEFGGLRNLAEGMRERFLRWEECRSRWNEARERFERVRERRELLGFQATEISSMRLQPGEEKDLTERRVVLQNIGKLYELAREGDDLLYSGDAAVIGRLERYLARGSSLLKLAPVLQGVRENLSSSLAQLRESARLLAGFAESTSFDPEELERIEERLSAMQRLKRKYGDSVEEILVHLAEIEEERRADTSLEESIPKLEKELEGARRSAEEHAEKLSSERKQLAKTIRKLIESELGSLGMKGSRFELRFANGERTLTESGLDRLEFFLSPNPGEEPRPLARIASGGELSRIMLAIKTATHGGGDVDTLIFDEVDVGIGGRVAEIVGDKLKQVAARHQVLCITHLPQIAAFADLHFRIRKELRRGRSVSVAESLEGKERVEELARMLGGVEITDQVRKHAEELASRKGATG